MRFLIHPRARGRKSLLRLPLCQLRGGTREVAGLETAAHLQVLDGALAKDGELVERAHGLAAVVAHKAQLQKLDPRGRHDAERLHAHAEPRSRVYSGRSRSQAGLAHAVGGRVRLSQNPSRLGKTADSRIIIISRITKKHAPPTPTWFDIMISKCAAVLRHT